MTSRTLSQEIQDKCVSELMSTPHIDLVESTASQGGCGGLKLQKTTEYASYYLLACRLRV